MNKTVVDALKEYDIADINNRTEQFIELQRGYKQASLQFNHINSIHII